MFELIDYKDKQEKNVTHKKTKDNVENKKKRKVGFLKVI